MKKSPLLVNIMVQSVQLTQLSQNPLSGRIQAMGPACCPNVLPPTRRKGLQRNLSGGERKAVWSSGVATCVTVAGHLWMSRGPIQRRAPLPESERACPSCRKPERRSPASLGIVQRPPRRKRDPVGESQRLETIKRCCYGTWGGRMPSRTASSHSRRSPLWPRTPGEATVSARTRGAGPLW